MANVVIDCTELYQNPTRTGIQRVVRNLLRHWPAGGPTVHLARFTGSDLVRIPDRMYRTLSDEEPGVADRPAAEIQRLLAAASSAAVVEPLPAALTLVPEVFYDLGRSEFHASRVQTLRLPLAMVAYDFFPFLQPHLFRIRSAAPLMGYLKAIRAATSVAHISAETKQAYQHRVMRGKGADGPVLPLGADGLDIERQTWAPQRKSFVSLGSLDGRKNQQVIVGAFRRLWDNGHAVPLVLIGSTFPHLDDRWLRDVLPCPHFRWLSEATDLDIARELRGARATIYASTAEGFGLPPIESLAAGIPVIASAEIPSLARLPSGGQIRLDQISEQTIADGVMTLVDDRDAERLWTEAAQHRLTTWHEFARSVAGWLAAL